MEFVAPLMLVGLLGIAIPIAVHLIGRRRARRVPFAAVDFLLGSDRKLARKLRIRELLLLLARILVCLAIPLALAKPYAACKQQGPVVERGPQAAVIVIDDSLAGRYQRDGDSLIARAKAEARTILGRLGPEAEVAIITAARADAGSTELSRDHVGLTAIISGVTATYLPADTTAALRRAAKLLAESSHAKQTIYVVSALAATGFGDTRLPWTAGTGPAVRAVDLAPDAPLDNAAVTAIEIAPDSNAGSRGIRITAKITNFGVSPIEDRGVAVEIAGRVVSQGKLALAPGETATKRFAATLPRGARMAELSVALEPDALAADDRRYAIAELREQLQVLLVNGDPRTVRHDDELFYFETALRPGDRADSGFAITRATAEDLPELNLSRFDVIVLANVSALQAGHVAALVTFVEAGGGLLISMGSKVDADRYNASMLPVLPQALQTKLDSVYGKLGAERQGRSLRLTKIDIDHPALAIFAEDATGLREAAFSTVMLLGPTTRLEERRVLARYESGAAALVEGRIGSGRILVYTSTLDRDWNDLAIQPGYLPLWQQVVRHLGKRTQRRDAGELWVGRATTIAAADTDQRIEVRTPTGERIVIEGDRLSDRNSVRLDQTQSPGFYRVSAAAATGGMQRRPESDLAINIDPRASDLTRIDSLPTDTPTATVTETEPQKRRVELWHALAAALLAFLAIESVLSLRS